MGNSFYRKFKNKTYNRNLKISNRLISVALVMAISLMGINLAVNSNRASINIADTATSGESINILNPTPDAYVGNTTNLEADLSGASLSDYDMYWYVDNGSWNWMGNSQNGEYKQAQIGFSGWNWHAPSTLYTLTLVAVMHGSGQRFYSGVQINIGTAPTSSTSTPVSAPAPAQQLYVSPNSDAAQTAQTTTDPTMERIMTKIAAQPEATWFGGWNSNVQSDVSTLVDAAASDNRTPVLVTYNIPERDCGSYSSGGATSATAYQSWISSFAAGLGTHNAIVIVEPDALAQISCLSSSDQTQRYQLIAFAVGQLKQDPNAKVYIDAGNPSWISASDMASRLKLAGIANADGFSLNVSNFYSTSQNETYGAQLSALVGGKHFVIDTGRNGNGSNGQWCNPSGMALGNTPSASTGDSLVDYFLWIKPPGQSDGTCNGGPAAGTWWPTYAEQLGLNAGW